MTIFMLTVLERIQIQYELWFLKFDTMRIRGYEFIPNLPHSTIHSWNEYCFSAVPPLSFSWYSMWYE